MKPQVLLLRWAFLARPFVVKSPKLPQACGQLDIKPFSRARFGSMAFVAYYNVFYLEAAGS